MQDGGENISSGCHYKKTVVLKPHMFQNTDIYYLIAVYASTFFTL